MYGRGGYVFLNTLGVHFRGVPPGTLVLGGFNVLRGECSWGGGYLSPLSHLPSTLPTIRWSQWMLVGTAAVSRLASINWRMAVWALASCSATRSGLSLRYACPFSILPLVGSCRCAASSFVAKGRGRACSPPESEALYRPRASDNALKRPGIQARCVAAMARPGF